MQHRATPAVIVVVFVTQREKNAVKVKVVVGNRTQSSEVIFGGIYQGIETDTHQR
jgi:hypothetical protein